MPGLVRTKETLPGNKKNNSRKRKPGPEDEEAAAIAAYSRELNRQNSARRWMIGGVIIFISIIGALWGWSIKLRISQIHWDGSAEQRLVEDSRQNWNNAFNRGTIATSSTELAKEKVKEAITLLMEATSSSLKQTSTTSTTTTIR